MFQFDVQLEVQLDFQFDVRLAIQSCFRLEHLTIAICYFNLKECCDVNLSSDLKLK